MVIGCFLAILYDDFRPQKWHYWLIALSIVVNLYFHDLGLAFQSDRDESGLAALAPTALHAFCWCYYIFVVSRNRAKHENSLMRRYFRSSLLYLAGCLVLLLVASNATSLFYDLPIPNILLEAVIKLVLALSFTFFLAGFATRRNAVSIAFAVRFMGG